MSAEETLQLLRGERAGRAFGASWVPTELERSTGEQTLPARAREIRLDFAFVDAGLPWAAKEVAALLAADVVAVWSVTGVVGRVVGRRGWSEVIRTSAADPSALAVPIAEAQHDALEDVRRGIAAGARAFVVADDLSSSAGWLVSPDFALDAAAPCYASLAREIGGLNAASIFHSDGNVASLYPALRAAGFSAIHLAGISAEGVGQAASDVRSAGMVPVGGISVGALGEGIGEAARRAVALARAGTIALCDDGGLTTEDELAELGDVLASARATLSDG